jgi:hypothetical protein
MTPDTQSTAGPVSETILRTQDEGWSVTLSAVHGLTGWGAFTVVCDDHPPIEMLGDPGDEEPETMVKFAGPAETWEGALKLLDRIVWHVLTPEYVHPDFRQAVLAVVRERAADKDDPCAEIVEYWLPNWELKCAPSENV